MPAVGGLGQVEGSETVKLITLTCVTVDGVMQGLGGPDEDRRGGFERGGWQGPLWDDGAGKFMTDIYGRADTFLFGRLTYEIFAGSWGLLADDPGDNVIAVALNTRPKYVVSNTLTEATWRDTTVLSGDVATAIRELKAKPGGELQVHGSGALVRWLLDNELVDELNLIISPLILGQGTRLFAENGLDTVLELLASEPTPKGGMIQVYRPNGRPSYRRSDA